MFTEYSQHTRAMLANACGSISLASWIILLLPQLIEQWRLKSADGVAIGFIMAWFFGDLANLLGAIVGQLRSSIILLALWFCFSDSLLIVSYFYYKRLNHACQTRLSPRATSPNVDQEHQAGDQQANAQTPLLQEVNASTAQSVSSVNSAVEDRRNWMLGTFLPAVFVIVVATLSYLISDSDGNEDVPVKSDSAQFLGYLSAALYLVARIPQIVQNHQRRSVEGLSMGFFSLSILGNLTYAAQVIFLRTDREWLIAYFPWLLGSLGTIAEDMVVLAQFHIYKRTSRTSH